MIFGTKPSEPQTCIGCRKPTNPNHPDYEIGYFVNRIPADDGWLCAHCGGFECNECGEDIYIDCEVRIDSGNNYHLDCARKLVRLGALTLRDIKWGFYEEGEE